jgi:glutathione S-transferase
MITLHGFAVSNYYNMVKHVLLYKNVPFEEHKVYPGDEALLAVSPVGKVPAMTTDSGLNLSETLVILDYLEEKYPDNPLYPADVEERARVRQMIKVTELYIELQARRLLGAVFTGQQAPDELKQEVRGVLERGIKGLNDLTRFGPYIDGEVMTMADIVLRYSLMLPKMVGPSQLDWDIVAAIDGAPAWDAMMAESDIARKIDADHAANTDEFFARIRGAA